jgi:hypothetical protein
MPRPAPVISAVLPAKSVATAVSAGDHRPAVRLFVDACVHAAS